MSYSIYIFHPEVKQRVDSGLEIDEFEHPPLNPSEVAVFLERLETYEYESESKNPESTEYVKNVGGCPITVSIYNTEISFSVPFWEGSNEAIYEAIQDAIELSDSDEMVLYDPQTEEWII